MDDSYIAQQTSYPRRLGRVAKLDKDEATAAMQKVVLSMSRDSPFGRISNKALFLLRGDMWLNDDCMMHAMTTLQEKDKLIRLPLSDRT